MRAGGQPLRARRGRSDGRVDVAAELPDTPTEHPMLRKVLAQDPGASLVERGERMPQPRRLGCAAVVMFDGRVELVQKRPDAWSAERCGHAADAAAQDVVIVVVLQRAVALRFIGTAAGAATSTSASATLTEIADAEAAAAAASSCVGCAAATWRCSGCTTACSATTGSTGTRRRSPG